MALQFIAYNKDFPIHFGDFVFLKSLDIIKCWLQIMHACTFLDDLDITRICISTLWSIYKAGLKNKENRTKYNTKDKAVKSNYSTLPMR